MDFATPLGIVIAFVAIFASMIMDGGQPAALVSSPSALVLVLLGTFGASMASQQLSDIKNVLKATTRMMKPSKPADSVATVAVLVEMADIARKQGLLALEERAKAIEDPLLRRGLQLVVDGSDAEAVELALFAEIDGTRSRHKVPAKFWGDMAGFSPTFGIIGTVLGLIHVLGSLSDPGKLGPLIATAFLATLWGVLLANAVYLPISNKMKRASSAELAYAELVLTGVLAVQAGDSPRIVGERLESNLPPSKRGGEKPALSAVPDSKTA
jgi:chemotaxis protein MotA